VLRALAFVSLLFPFLIAAALYGEWLLAWSALGHPPRPSLDDPKDISGSSWMHGITAIVLMGAVPAALGAVALTVAHIAVNRPSVARAAVRIVVIVGTWLALFGLLRWDPGLVVYWWMD
jgi:hypothetical protein